ncbi:unnamed protein product [Paramecium primaurelia]|uniref:Uncharacterized protein n=1 Tax=Paramecium primaurelia TaxID=5886 RepID=A0A8S1P4R1_PARPR|nr:unnamed protein product [Paramecium primaurelia]
MSLEISVLLYNYMSLNSLFTPHQPITHHQNLIHRLRVLEAYLTRNNQCMELAINHKPLLLDDTRLRNYSLLQLLTQFKHSIHLHTLNIINFTNLHKNVVTSLANKCDSLDKLFFSKCPTNLNQEESNYQHNIFNIHLFHCIFIIYKTNQIFSQRWT